MKLTHIFVILSSLAATTSSAQRAYANETIELDCGQWHITIEDGLDSISYAAYSQSSGSLRLDNGYKVDHGEFVNYFFENGAYEYEVFSLPGPNMMLTVRRGGHVLMEQFCEVLSSTWS